jgi:Domain of unknown function (DUF4249)
MRNYLYCEYLICIMIILFCIHCEIPYNPQVTSSGTGYLVVDGFIDGGAPTVIDLSRTITLSDTSEPVPETGAQVIVEDDHNDKYGLTDEGEGVYSSVNTLSLNSAYDYRIHIFTSGGEEYESDFVPVKVSPPIDSINWVLKDGGVQVYANTHENQSGVGYYRWNYNETWEVRSEYTSYYEFNVDSNKVEPRNDQVYQCWPSDYSTNIILGSTAKLKSNVIYEQPVTYIADHDQRISVLYSILVTQYALDTTGYNFWLAMQNNTEQIGSLFDPQPSNVTGNIHCITHPDETVIGYVGAGITTQARIFINNDQMPLTWNLLPYCQYMQVPDDSVQYYFEYMGYTPIDQGIGYYTAALTPCVDCTVFGTNVKPSFWP